MTYDPNTPDTNLGADARAMLAIEYLAASGIHVSIGDVEIGAVELKDAATDTRGKVVIGSDAATGDNALVVADPNVLAKMPAKGTAAMAASVPFTLATDDTQFGAVGAASDVDGNVHGQLRYIGETLTTPTEKAPSITAVVVAAGPTATALGNNGTFVLSVTVVAKTTNLSNIMFGIIGSQIYPIAPGQSVSFPVAEGTKVDLNDLYINGTAGEGVYVFYQGA